MRIDRVRNTDVRVAVRQEEVMEKVKGNKEHGRRSWSKWKMVD